MKKARLIGYRVYDVSGTMGTRLMCLNRSEWFPASISIASKIIDSGLLL